MPTNQFLAYATGGGANVVDQATYAAASYVGSGRGSGILPSNVYNKIARQGNFVASAVAQLIVNQLGVDVLDNGDQAAFVAQLLSAITSISSSNFTTGDGKLTMKSVADTGWVMMNDGTIGDASSGGTTRANADCSALFSLLWNNVSNTYAPVSGGRGGSAAADFAAHKTIALAKQLGRAITIAGAGSGLTARALGETYGVETVQLSEAQLPAHTHANTLTFNDPGHSHNIRGNRITGGGPWVSDFGTSADENISGVQPNTTGITISITNAAIGSSQAHTNLPPSTGWNIEIKL
jgi:microcystin-dependent protein